MLHCSQEITDRGFAPWHWWSKKLQALGLLFHLASNYTQYLRICDSVVPTSENLRFAQYVTTVKEAQTSFRVCRRKHAQNGRGADLVSEEIEGSTSVSAMFAQSSSSYPKCRRRKGRKKNDFSSIFGELPQSFIVAFGFKGDWTGPCRVTTLKKIILTVFSWPILPSYQVVCLDDHSQVPHCGSVNNATQNRLLKGHAFLY